MDIKEIMIKSIGEANKEQKDLVDKYNNMNDLEQIYICALRYALGRQNYITSVVSDYLCKQELSQKCKGVMIRDIEECQDYGHDCDKRSWMKLLTYLTE